MELQICVTIIVPSISMSSETICIVKGVKINQVAEVSQFIQSDLFGRGLSTEPIYYKTDTQSEDMHTSDKILYVKIDGVSHRKSFVTWVENDLSKKFDMHLSVRLSQHNDRFAGTWAVQARFFNRQKIDENVLFLELKEAYNVHKIYCKTFSDNTGGEVHLFFNELEEASTFLYDHQNSRMIGDYGRELLQKVRPIKKTNVFLKLISEMETWNLHVGRAISVSFLRDWYSNHPEFQDMYKNNGSNDPVEIPYESLSDEINKQIFLKYNLVLNAKNNMFEDELSKMEEITGNQYKNYGKEATAPTKCAWDSPPRSVSIVSVSSEVWEELEIVPEFVEEIQQVTENLMQNDHIIKLQSELLIESEKVAKAEQQILQLTEEKNIQKVEFEYQLSTARIEEKIRNASCEKVMELNIATCNDKVKQSDVLLQESQQNLDKMKEAEKLYDIKSDRERAHILSLENKLVDADKKFMELTEKLNHQVIEIKKNEEMLLEMQDKCKSGIMATGTGITTKLHVKLSGMEQLSFDKVQTYVISDNETEMTELFEVRIVLLENRFGIPKNKENRLHTRLNILHEEIMQY